MYLRCLGKYYYYYLLLLLLFVWLLQCWVFFGWRGFEVPGVSSGPGWGPHLPPLVIGPLPLWRSFFPNRKLSSTSSTALLLSFEFILGTLATVLYSPQLRRRYSWPVTIVTVINVISRRRTLCGCCRIGVSEHVV
jgi:hypothetical protein